MRRYALIFVCQAGRLETQAALLAASLNRFVRFDHELIAAIPGPADVWGQISAPVLSFFAKLGVRTVNVANEFGAAYPIANKLGCLSIQTTADKLIFLDTDMLAMAPWDDDNRFSIPLNARPASISSFSADDRHWQTVYAACEARPLPGKVRTTYTNQLIRPYFNSAFVAVPAHIDFGNAWLDCCRRIDRLPDIPHQRPHLDQIALSPAISRLGLEYDCLDERFNHPINYKPLDETRLPFLCHYHDTPTLAREPAAVSLTRNLIGQHPDLSAILRADSAWSEITGTLGEKLSLTGPDLLITGIPRSGTSYLCNLLNHHDNCLVLNEPDDPAAKLDGPEGSLRLSLFLRQTRHDVVAGKPIRNKLTTDTATSNDITSYVPQVAAPDFVLGIKKTIAFLSRLPQLRRALPSARIVACVRNPFDAIASWKTTFDHLREADVTAVPVGHLHDPCLSAAQQAELEQIAALPDLATRRAAWWSYFARQLIDSIDQLVLVKYEELVTDPSQALKTILDGAGNRAEPIAPSQPRSKAASLDSADVQAIRSLCSAAAQRLGVYRAGP